MLRKILISGTVFLLIFGITTFFLFRTASNSADNLLIDANSKIYNNAEFGFSLFVPVGVEIEEFEEGDGGKTILFKEKESKKSFQVFIGPLEGEGPIEKEEILKSIPTADFNDSKEVILSGGQRALIFLSYDESRGKLREALLIRGKLLYQFSTYYDLDNWLAGVLSSLRFLD